jgi:hypothetical protein
VGKAFDRYLGARDFNWSFAKYIELTKKHGVDSFSNPKNKFEHLLAVERLRKVLSGGSDDILHGYS